MRLLLLFFTILFLTVDVLAQKEDHIWILGNYNTPDSLYFPMKLNFNFSPPLATRINLDITMRHTNTMICSGEGEMVCASNGVDIWNNDFQVIENGGELQSGSSYSLNQGAIFLPAPENNNEYYLVSGDAVFFELNGGEIAGGCSPVTYTKVSFDNNNQGEAIERKIVMTTDTLRLGLFTATKHGNGRDWWLISNKLMSNTYYRFLLTPDGIEQHESQSIGEPIIPGLAQTAFSRNGEWYAQYNWSGIIGQNTDVFIDLYRFDRCDGLLSNHLRIFYEEGVVGGVSFSPNNELMYITHWDKIYQYDLTSSDIAASIDTVAIYDGFTSQNQNTTYATRFYIMQNSPDEKIIVSCPNAKSRFLHVIDSPNVRGDGCNVLQHSIELPSFNNFTLPNFPNFRLKELTNSPCDTLRPIADFTHSSDMLDVDFEDRSIRDVDSWLWEFGDGETSEMQNPEYLYSMPGTYEVCLTVGNEIGSDSICKEIILTTVGLADLDNKLEISIQPNPVIDELNIYFNAPLETNLTFNLLNATGIPVIKNDLRMGINDFKTIIDLPASIYFYKIENEKLQIIAAGKLVISR